MNKRMCPVCGFVLCKKNKSGFCNRHRDRTGSNNPFWGKHHSQKTVDKIKAVTKEKSTEKWKDATYRDKVIKAVSKPRRSSFKQEQSERIRQWYIDNPKQRNIRKVSMSENWQRGIITKNGYSYNRSSIEIEFFDKLNDVCFIEKETIRVDKKWFFPDVLIPRDGIVIEFFGNFWHANPSMYKADDIIFDSLTAREIWNRDAERIKVLEIKGYYVIVVWEKEYRESPGVVIDNLNKLLNWESCSL